jgi:flagellar protein FlaG
LRIDGVDPLTMNKIHGETQRGMVHEAKGIDSVRRVRANEAEHRLLNLKSGTNKIASELVEAVEQVNDTAEALDLGLRFRLHEETDRFIVQIVDRKSNEVIKEIPPERLLNLVGQIHDMIGVLLDEKR